ncbi:MAG TPA: translation elongation factor Ts [Candidatus Bathyarchaeia archaeon]|nr:translation elongation factor Ts [Candidatus Bathyarchaeia archaeon]
MAEVTIDQIKKLREKTGAGVMDCRRALKETKGNLKAAEAWLAKKGIKAAAKRVGRETSQGTISAYTHHDKTVASLVILTSETDFVARTKEFKDLAYELAMQVTATNPKDTKSLLAQPWIRDEKRKVKDLVNQLTAKTGENIKVKEFTRLALRK